MVVAPIWAPTLGGYITDHYSWRWIFYINIPVGILSLILTTLSSWIRPEWTKTSRHAEARLKFDYVGLFLGLAGTGITRGHLRQGSRVGLVQRPVLAPDVLHRQSSGWRPSLSGSTAPNPIVNVRLLGERHFLAWFVEDIGFHSKASVTWNS